MLKEKMKFDRIETFPPGILESGDVVQPIASFKSVDSFHGVFHVAAHVASGTVKILRKKNEPIDFFNLSAPIQEYREATNIPCGLLFALVSDVDWSFMEETPEMIRERVREDASIAMSLEDWNALDPKVLNFYKGRLLRPTDCGVQDGIGYALVFSRTGNNDNLKLEPVKIVEALECASN